MSRNLSRYRDLQLPVVNYLRQANHYSYHSYVFYPCENFEEFINYSLEADLNRLLKEKVIPVLPDLENIRDYSNFPICYMVLTPVTLFEHDFQKAANFLSGLITLIDLPDPDYDRPDLLAQILCTSDPLFIKFKKVARNIDDFPLSDKLIENVTDLHTSIPYDIREEIESVIEIDKY